MKKNASLLTMLAVPAAAFAQHRIDRDVLHIGATILSIALFMVFFLTFLKWILDYRLKNRIIDKGIPESVASSILQTGVRNERHIIIKWFALLAALGAGLMLIHFTPPLGIHSLALMALSLAAGFLGYYFFTRPPARNQ